LKIDVTSYFKADLRLRADVRLMTRRISAMRGGDMTQVEYRSVVAGRVAKLAQRLRPGTELYRRSLGAFPTVVRESLDALSARFSFCPPAPGGAEDIADDATAWENDECDPIGGQWYFDLPSVVRLLSLLPAGAGSLLAMGVPTIGGPAAQLVNDVRVLDRSKILARENLALAEAAKSTGLEVVEWDLDEKPYLDASGMDVVLMDPPWYLDHYRAWLHTAVEACRVGGLIGVVLPQILTNRRSVADRSELLQTLREIGHVSVRPNVLSYVTPSFERAVLDANKVGLLSRWRQADLALVRLRAKRLPYEFEPVSDIEWTYREIGGQIVRSWGEPVFDPRMPAIGPVDAAAGYRLRSVSRLYLRTSGINLLTSQGGAAVVTRWGRLPLILDLLRDGYSPPVAIKMALPDATPKDQQKLAKTLEEILRPYGSAAAAAYGG
jgi:hypothetical protein